MVFVEGRLDSTTVARVRPRLYAVVGAGSGDLVIDLSRVETIDENGLGVLVGVHRRAARTGRRLTLRAVSPPVQQVLVSTRLYRTLPVQAAVA